jgi:hypothetical protein
MGCRQRPVRAGERLALAHTDEPTPLPCVKSRRDPRTSPNPQAEQDEHATYDQQRHDTAFAPYQENDATSDGNQAQKQQDVSEPFHSSTLVAAYGCSIRTPLQRHPGTSARLLRPRLLDVDASREPGAQLFGLSRRGGRTTHGHGHGLDSVVERNDRHPLHRGRARRMTYWRRSMDDLPERLRQVEAQSLPRSVGREHAQDANARRTTTPSSSHGG